ncbi:MAG: hypothetical protein WCP31_05780 [Chloroflexales bacterium]
MVPVLRDRETPPRETGAAWFAKQDEATQRAMLGPGKQKLYAEGTPALADLVGVKDDARWGRSRYQRSLREIQAGTHTPSRSSGSGGAGGAGALGATPSPGRFATLEEAHAWATQQYPHITWDFTGTHIDAINPTLDQFERLAQEWPKVVEQLKYVGTHQGTNAPYPVQWNDSYADSDGGTLGRGRYIGLNPLHYSNPTQFLTALQRDVQTGFHPKGCDTIESVLTHEFGHLTEAWLRSRRDAFRAVVDDDGFGMAHATFHLWSKANVAQFTLSEYATEKVIEGWAEGFAAVYHMPRGDWPVFVQHQAVLLEMMQRTPFQSSQRLRDLSGDAHTLAEKALQHDRQQVGIPVRSL